MLPDGCVLFLQRVESLLHHARPESTVRSVPLGSHWCFARLQQQTAPPINAGCYLPTVERAPITLRTASVGAPLSALERPSGTFHVARTLLQAQSLLERIHVLSRDAIRATDSKRRQFSLRDPRTHRLLPNLEVRGDLRRRQEGLCSFARREFSTGPTHWVSLHSFAATGGVVRSWSLTALCFAPMSAPPSPSPTGGRPAHSPATRRLRPAHAAETADAPVRPAAGRATGSARLGPPRSSGARAE